MQLAMRPRQTMKSMENFSQHTVKNLHHIKFKDYVISPDIFWDSCGLYIYR